MATFLWHEEETLEEEHARKLKSNALNAPLISWKEIRISGKCPVCGETRVDKGRYLCGYASAGETIIYHCKNHNCVCQIEVLLRYGCLCQS